MRDNSGQGDNENNLRDPTLKEHDAEKDRAPASSADDEPAIGSPDEEGADRSPADRARGETGSDDRPTHTVGG